MNTRMLKTVGVVITLILTYIFIDLIWQVQQKRELYDSKTQLLRQLAASDDSTLADILDHSVAYIPAGEFLRGSNTGNYNEGPQQVVYLDAFMIDLYEVTNIQYSRFLREKGSAPPSYWIEKEYPRGQADYPVVGVSWNDANAYCTWAGKCLPTEAEWEKACRSSDGRQYPWGNQWDAQRANVGELTGAVSPFGEAGSPTAWAYAWERLQSTPVAGQPGLRPVGSYPMGASPYGVMDLAGNASEWVFDWYNWGDYSNIPTHNPVNLEPPWNHSLRGSSWHDPAGDLSWVERMSRCSARSSAHASSDPRQGFRCAESIASRSK